MLKISHLARAIAIPWAIAFAKYAISAKNINYLKHLKSESVFTLN